MFSCWLSGFIHINMRRSNCKSRTLGTYAGYLDFLRQGRRGQFGAIDAQSVGPRSVA